MMIIKDKNIEIGDWIKGKTLSNDEIIDEITDIRLFPEYLRDHISTLRGRVIPVENIIEIRRKENK